MTGAPGKPIRKTLAVINCSQLLTLAGARRPRTGGDLRQLSIIEDGALLLCGDRIETVGRRREIESLIPEDCEVIDAGRRVVMPGFVDAHTHPVFAGIRANEFEQRTTGATYREIAARGGGIRATVRATRNASLSDLVRIGKRYAEWFLRSGTTTIEAKSGYGLTIEDELKILHAIKQLNDETQLRYVPTFLGAHDIPSEYKSRRATYVNLIINEMLPRVAEERLAEYCDVFCEQDVFTTDEAWQILSAVAKLAAELNTATADHLEHTDPTGIAALKVAGVQPVLLPGSVYALGSKHYPAAREMIDAGLAVVLATDFNPGSSPTPSMPMILSLACTQMKLTPAEAITASTINAAYSLGRGDEIGSLEKGKRADFVIHDCEDYRELAYFFGIEHPWRVFSSGKSAFSRSVSEARP